MRMSFEIAEDGSISFKASPDAEDSQDENADNVYVIQVTATAEDADSNTISSETQDVAVIVTNVNEATDGVIFDSGLVATVEENIDSHTVVLEMGAEFNGGAAERLITYDLAGADARLFEISRDGELTFKEAPGL